MWRWNADGFVLSSSTLWLLLLLLMGMAEFRIRKMELVVVSSQIGKARRESLLLFLAVSSKYDDLRLSTQG